MSTTNIKLIYSFIFVLFLNIMMIKSIRFKNIKNLTLIIGNVKKRPMKQNFIKDSVEKKTQSKIKKNEKAIECDDEYIQRIIRNGGL